MVALRSTGERDADREPARDDAGVDVGVEALDTLHEDAGDLPQFGDVDLYPTMLRSLSPSATPGKSTADQSMIAGSMLMVLIKCDSWLMSESLDCKSR